MRIKEQENDMIKHYQTTLYQQQQKAKPAGYHAASPIHTTESGDSLFKLTARAHFIAEIKKAVKTPTEHFDALYLALSHNVGEFVQQIPTVEDPAIQWLDLALQRSQQALRLLDERLQNSQAANKMSGPYKAQLTYAVFSAALLQHIDVMVTQWAAHICTEQGDFIKEWQPLAESLFPTANYYQIKLQASYSDDTSLHPITVLLAKNLMPTDGLLWLASHTQLFQEWLSALLGEEGRGSLIESILAVIPGLRPPPKEHFVLHPHPIFPAQPQSPVPAVAPSQPVQPPIAGNTLPEDFIEWLKQGILDGSILHNTPEAWIQMTRIGLYINPRIFEYFCRIHPNAPSWQNMFQLVCARLGIPTHSNAAMHNVFINGKPQPPGVVVDKNISLFFPHNVAPSVSPVATIGNSGIQADAYPTLLHSDAHKKRGFNKKSEG
jgi:hypothetical protein